MDKVKSIKLSIIVPVYNVEKYIVQCLESIFKQELDEEIFEVIIVNDGTKDRSMNVIQDIIDQHKNIIVINQENQGLSVARNNGIAMAKGEYILMPDSDDLLIEYSLKPLLEKAIETKVDLVVADYLIMNDKDIICLDKISQKTFEFQNKTGEKLFIEDLNPYHCYVWRTLFRKAFIQENHIQFVPGVYYQDVPFTHECYIKAKQCLRCSWLLNIYRTGHNSATSTFDMKRAKHFCIVIAKTWQLTKLGVLNSNMQQKLHDDIFTSFLFMSRHVIYFIEKSSERNKIIDFLKKEAPNLEFGNRTIQKVTTYFYQKMPHTFYHLYYCYIKIQQAGMLPYIRKYKLFNK